MYPWPVFKIHMHEGLRLRRNTVNISVLNHEGEPMDITQATCKLCAIVMPVNVYSHYTESESKKKKNLTEFSNATLTGHILSETNLLQHVLIAVQMNRPVLKTPSTTTTLFWVVSKKLLVFTRQGSRVRPIWSHVRPNFSRVRQKKIWGRTCATSRSRREKKSIRDSESPCASTTDTH